jgi:hypothetical protein
MERQIQIRDSSSDDEGQNSSQGPMGRIRDTEGSRNAQLLEGGGNMRGSLASSTSLLSRSEEDISPIFGLPPVLDLSGEAFYFDAEPQPWDVLDEEFEFDAGKDPLGSTPEVDNPWESHK